MLYEMNGSENLFLNLGQLSDLLRTRWLDSAMLTRPTFPAF